MTTARTNVQRFATPTSGAKEIALAAFMSLFVPCALQCRLGHAQDLRPSDTAGNRSGNSSQNPQVYRSYRPGSRTVTNGQVHARSLANSNSRSSVAARTLRPELVRPDLLRPDLHRPAYRLDSGDVVAVIVFGVTGTYSRAPVHMPTDGDGTLPAVGNPMVVMPDGALPMPLLQPVLVRGLTVTEARDKISRAYVDEKILKQDRQVTLSLMRKRTVTVSVLHDDPGFAQRSVSQVQVQADGPQVLQAMVKSGPFDRDASVNVIQSGGRGRSSASRLTDGDIVHIQSARPGQFFTGGQLRGGVFALPANRTVDVLQAIAIAGGVQSGAVAGSRSSLGLRALGPTQVILVHRGGGSTRIPYGQLLRNPNAWVMRSGDTLIVR